MLNFSNSLKLVESGNAANIALGVTLIRNYPQEFKEHFGSDAPEMFTLVEALAYEDIRGSIGMSWSLLDKNMKIAQKYKDYYSIIKDLERREQVSEEGTILTKINALKRYIKLL